MVMSPSMKWNWGWPSEWSSLDEERSIPYTCQSVVVTMRWVRALPMKPLTPRMSTFMNEPPSAETLARRDPGGQRQRAGGQLGLPFHLQGDETHGAFTGRHRDAVRADRSDSSRL